MIDNNNPNNNNNNNDDIPEEDLAKLYDEFAKSTSSSSSSSSQNSSMSFSAFSPKSLFASVTKVVKLPVSWLFSDDLETENVTTEYKQQPQNVPVNVDVIQQGNQEQPQQIYSGNNELSGKEKEENTIDEINDEQHQQQVPMIQQVTDVHISDTITEPRLLDRLSKIGASVDINTKKTQAYSGMPYASYRQGNRWRPGTLESQPELIDGGMPQIFRNGDFAKFTDKSFLRAVRLHPYGEAKDRAMMKDIVMNSFRQMDEIQENQRKAKYKFMQSIN